MSSLVSIQITLKPLKTGVCKEKLKKTKITQSVKFQEKINIYL